MSETETPFYNARALYHALLVVARTVIQMDGSTKFMRDGLEEIIEGFLNNEMKAEAKMLDFFLDDLNIGRKYPRPWPGSTPPWR